ncbi:MAG: pyruvate:ferredoxin (flavodoxin) oxidoreductase [Oscillospiraceae bacterium]|nr:pyruvate:ferredoxin (flavodoxin) oxidoreductase [Oscillospiraceae bacterium]
MLERKLKTMDGNTAAAHVAYAFSEVAAIYPITPSSPMAESMDEWASQGRKNIFGQKVKIVEMQSEGGAAGAVHGSVAAGSYTSTFTASQGLLLMIPNMYKLAGEQTPAVFHVAARALATHALSIFGDHSDVMGVRQTGFVMLCSNNVQQVMDLAAAAHLAAIGGRLPVLHFFDGFRTSHEYQKIKVWDYSTLSSLTDWDAVRRYRESALDPSNPHLSGSAEQPETFFQHREAANGAYLAAPEVVNGCMERINALLDTDYRPFNYYGAPDAEDIIIAMGSVCDAAEEVVDWLNARGGKTGVVEVHLYRPFSVKYLLAALPESVQRIAVLDRTKEPGGVGEPLYLDVVSALRGTKFEKCLICGGRYGLGSKDTQPADIAAAFANLRAEEPKREFTLSITDDVTGLSLAPTAAPDMAPAGMRACKFWGLGADGTVGANKNSVKIIGDHTDKYVQAYFQYDSKKSGGTTISHLRFGDTPIKSSYYVRQADFVACHNAAYLKKFEMVQDVKPGGCFLLNCGWTDEELDSRLPAAVKRYIAENNVQFYVCDAVKYAKEIGLGPRRTNTVLQAAFFKLADIIPVEDAARYMKEAIEHTYAEKGRNIVDMNCAAVDAGLEHVRKVVVPERWRTAADAAPAVPLTGRDKFTTDYLNNILVPTNTLTGDRVPVSAFLTTANGVVPSGTAAFEKRGIAADVPQWDAAKCIQCAWCSMVCPHGVIRTYALPEGSEEAEGAPAMKGAKGLRFAVGISALDCTGCGSCAEICPAREKALTMHEADDELVAAAQSRFNALSAAAGDAPSPFSPATVKGSQLRRPLMEFSGACPGCGESPYAKLATQLFGDRMYIANATGCSSIWGCSAPSSPYTVNGEGRGPAWANSLFEDNAEFGLGMRVSVDSRRAELKAAAESLGTPAALAWTRAMEDAEASRKTGDALLAECRALAGENSDAKFITENAGLLTKPSMWIFGGDGWAYDIGYGGLDHVLASGMNVNVLVFDTEVYSNTGGQSSKATPMGAVAAFASAGKAVKKKNLADIAMSYGYVYVAQVAMGANPEQTLRAFCEAEAYDGPSLIIAYAPCINHGLKAGMNRAMQEMRSAVRSGYWNLLRFDPDRAARGENPLSVDSAAPDGSYHGFIMGEVRYSSLKLKFPERAEKLFSEAESGAQERYAALTARKKSLDRG